MRIHCDFDSFLFAPTISARISLLTQQALSDQELSALQILAMRRRMKLGDLESDDEPPVRREAPAAAPAPAPGLDTGLFMGRIERVEHQVTNSTCVLVTRKPFDSNVCVSSSTLSC